MNRAQRVKTVVDQLQRLYPKQLADNSWDNTGLLVDALSPSYPAEKDTDTRNEPNVLFTIDLTESVCEEAIKLKSDLIVAYHPFIFSGIKAVSSKNPQHRSLTRLLQHKISVYSPHTAVDASVKGVNDFLVHGVTNQNENTLSCTTVQPVANSVAGQERAGYGRLVELKEPVPLSELIKSVKSHLWLRVVQLVKAARHDDTPIKTIALCAGSGGSVLRGVNADLWLTGELGHHEMLFLKESGTSAIVCGHSNTERGFLPVFRAQLLAALKAQGIQCNITISATDVDPIEYV